jgi:hypothetical protein
MNPAAKRQQQTGSEERATDSGGLRNMIDEQQLLEMIPMSRSTLHRLQKKGASPKGSTSAKIENSISWTLSSAGKTPWMSSIRTGNAAKVVVAVFHPVPASATVISRSYWGLAGSTARRFLSGEIAETPVSQRFLSFLVLKK